MCIIVLPSPIPSTAAQRELCSIEAYFLPLLSIIHTVCVLLSLFYTLSFIDPSVFELTDALKFCFTCSDRRLLITLQISFPSSFMVALCRMQRNSQHRMKYCPCCPMSYSLFCSSCVVLKRLTLTHTDDNFCTERDISLGTKMSHESLEWSFKYGRLRKRRTIYTELLLQLQISNYAPQ